VRLVDAKKETTVGDIWTRRLLKGLVWDETILPLRMVESKENALATVEGSRKIALPYFTERS
jgi:hypothetical protein